MYTDFGTGQSLWLPTFPAPEVLDTIRGTLAHTPCTPWRHAQSGKNRSADIWRDCAGYREEVCVSGREACVRRAYATRVVHLFFFNSPGQKPASILRDGEFIRNTKPSLRWGATPSAEDGDGVTPIVSACGSSLSDDVAHYRSLSRLFVKTRMNICMALFSSQFDSFLPNWTLLHCEHTRVPEWEKWSSFDAYVCAVQKQKKYIYNVCLCLKNHVIFGEWAAERSFGVREPDNARIVVTDVYRNHPTVCEIPARQGGHVVLLCSFRCPKPLGVPYCNSALFHLRSQELCKRCCLEHTIGG